MIQVGDTVDHFRILALKGQGSHSRVYVAEDTILKRKVALKVATQKVGLDSNKNPLLREARAMVDLLAPNTTRVFAVGEYEGENYLVFEYMHQTLRDEITTHGSLSWQNCLRTFLRITETINHLHRRGYVHCDVRPRNVMYDSRGLAYTSDMAVVRSADSVLWSDALKLAMKEMSLVKYAPPEARLLKEEYVVEQSFDIWSIGLVMYEALTGISLALSADEFDAKGFDENFKQPHVYNADIPHKFSEICRVCLSVDPAGRYTSNQLLSELRRINESERPFKPSVFISHASVDREFVEQHIVSFLESNGVSTWYSKAAIQSAAEWERSILQGLRESPWFLLVMSEASALSEWVKDEVFWGIDNRVNRIIPVLIDRVDIGEFHIRLRRIQAVNLQDDPEVNNQKILEILNDNN